MSRHSERREPSQSRGRIRPYSAVALGVLGLSALMIAPGVGKEAGVLAGAHYYSTAEAPRDYAGPKPTLLAMNEVDSGQAKPQAEAVTAPAAAVAEPSLPPPLAEKTIAAPAASAPPRIANASASTDRPPIAPLASRSVPKLPAPPPASEAVDPIALAKQSIADCQVKYQQIQDYTCTFYKRERIGGRLLPSAIMTMKARTNPHSVYFKFHQPNRGREAIYISGRNGGKILAHDVGIGKVLAGTMRLDPRGSMAMEDNRHPITEAGLGMLIDTVAKHWAIELTPEESQLTFNTNMQIDNRSCTMIESVHPRKNPGFLFHKVRLYIDHGLGLPIRFEAYDWPKHAGAAPELIEEYTYRNLRTNVGLREADFDPSNKQYSYGRF